MNYSKDPNLSKKILKEQKKLRQLAKRGKLEGKDRAKSSWDVEFDNYEEPVRVAPRGKDEDEYGEYL